MGPTSSRSNLKSHRTALPQHLRPLNAVRNCIIPPVLSIFVFGHRLVTLLARQSQRAWQKQASEVAKSPPPVAIKLQRNHHLCPLSPPVCVPSNTQPASSDIARGATHSTKQYPSLSTCTSSSNPSDSPPNPVPSSPPYKSSQ